MATYTVSQFSIDERHPMPLPSSPFALASGTMTINPYSQTPIAIVNITGLFRTSGLLRVLVDGMDSTSTFLLRWDAASKSVKAYSALATQATEGLTTIGVFNWIAIGQLG
jgi:hypothetical protein